MKTATAAKIAAQFDDYLDASQEQPVLITRNGKAVAVIMAVADKADAERLAVRRSRTLRSIFQEAHEQLEQGRGVPHDEFWQRVEQSRAKASKARRSKNG